MFKEINELINISSNIKAITKNDPENILCNDDGELSGEEDNDLS